MKRILAALMLTGLLGLLAPAPAAACYGEPCDAICAATAGANKFLPDSLQLTDCG